MDINATPVTATGPADLLAYVNHTLGFAPRNSVVGISMNGASLRAVLRADWSTEAVSDQFTPGAYAHQFADYLQADEAADACLVLLFRDGEAVSGDPTTEMDRELALALDRALAAAEQPMAEMWMICDGLAWRLDTDGPEVFSTHCVIVGRGESSVVNTALIVEGSVVEQAAVSLPQPARDASAELAAAMRAFRDDQTDRGICDWILSWDGILNGGPVPADPARRAFLLGGLVDPSLHGVLLASSALGVSTAVSGAVHAGDLRPAVAQSLGVTTDPDDVVPYLTSMVASTGQAPDWGRIDRLKDACIALMPEAAGASSCQLRILVAWVEWARGRGSAAGPILDEVRADGLHSDFARRLGAEVDNGRIAGWARSRETAWKRIRS